MNYKPVIGLEVHVELKTKSKMFCGCSADYFGKEPNSHTCPVCLGLPGALPVPNKKAIDWCVMIGLALNCTIPLQSKFDRKNYFYPDLSKGYQISQYDEPFCKDGYVNLSSHTVIPGLTRNLPGEILNQVQDDKKEGKRIGITRVHMEEDTGKLIHQDNATLIDFNRSGVPLVEIVTEPDFESASEVVEYLKKLQQIVRYLEVSNADMEKGDMRLEPNISLRKENESGLPNYKVEVKNINSFKFVDKAIQYEIKRQTEELNLGKRPAQETRGWDENKQKTLTQRSKEEAHDYRYFPEPDIPPIEWDKNYESLMKNQLPEMPDIKRKRFVNEYSLSDYDAEILTREKDTADYFEKAVTDGKEHNISPKNIANTIINKKVDTTSLLPAQLIEQIMLSKQIVEVNEGELEATVIKVVADNEKAVQDYKTGKVAVLGFLLGQVKKQFPKGDTNTIKAALEAFIQNT